MDSFPRDTLSDNEVIKQADREARYNMCFKKNNRTRYVHIRSAQYITYWIYTNERLRHNYDNKTIHSQVPLWRGTIYHNITYGAAITGAESESDFIITTDTPYLALTGELWGVYVGILEKVDRVITAPHYTSYKYEEKWQTMAHLQWQ